jgi:hypothetical protein
LTGLFKTESLWQSKIKKILKPKDISFNVFLGVAQPEWSRKRNAVRRTILEDTHCQMKLHISASRRRLRGSGGGSSHLGDAYSPHDL